MKQRSEGKEIIMPIQLQEETARVKEFETLRSEV
jgi:hypothetical protein